MNIKIVKQANGKAHRSRFCFNGKREMADAEMKAVSGGAHSYQFLHGKNVKRCFYCHKFVRIYEKICSYCGHKIH